MLPIAVPAGITLNCTGTGILVERKYSNLLHINMQALVHLFKNCLSNSFSQKFSSEYFF